MIINFNNFVNEEFKLLRISKIILEEVCSDFNLDFSKLKFLNSGSFGNAYSINDKVLKITTDIREVNDVYNIIGKKLQGVVKYYKIQKVRNTLYYAILMEKVITLEEFIKNKNFKIGNIVNYIDWILWYIWEYWNKIENLDEFIKILKKEEVSVKENHFEMWLIHKIWNLYKKIKWLKRPPDLHSGNIGFDKDENLVYFDFNKIGNNYRKVDF